MKRFVLVFSAAPLLAACMNAETAKLLQSDLSWMDSQPYAMQPIQPPPVPTQTNCRPDYAGGFSCTSY